MAAAGARRPAMWLLVAVSLLAVQFCVAKKDGSPEAAVEGSVVCQDCSKRGTWNLDGSRPVAGAQVFASCKHAVSQTKIFNVTSTTDENGYFYAALKGITSEKLNVTWGTGLQCTVKLLSSPDQSCDQLTNINAGFNGAPVHFLKHLSEIDLYSVGPFAFLLSTCAGGAAKGGSGSNGGSNDGPGGGSDDCAFGDFACFGFFANFGNFTGFPPNFPFGGGHY